MIKIDNLTKIYVSNKRNEIKALDNVSFSLADKGMVFICGKSGSGKSTLLNLIAGLDEITSGDIIVDGNSLKSLDSLSFDEYRNKLIGFIFQDYCLLDTFTIRENIELSLNLVGEDNNEKIKAILKEVDLEGYENRYPKELSGGQKQRVAIARALIKNPKYILADEPTGNLDSETSVQILNLLKKLSKDKLVLIISHSKENAYEYGDRIIELKDGRVLKDLTKNKKEYNLVCGDTIYLPLNVKLTEKQLYDVNKRIRTGMYSISQEDNMYVNTIQPEDNNQKEKLSKRKIMSFKNLLKLSKGFSKNYKLSLFFTSLMVSLLVIMMVITQVFTAFNGTYLIGNAIDEDTTEFVLYKGYYSDSFNTTLKKNRLVPTSNEEIDYFYNQGYEGNIYKLYSTNLVAYTSSSLNHAYPYSTSIDYSTLTNPYVEVGKGVLECDLNYLVKVYGTNGKLDLVAGTLSDTGKCELVITDYFADCLRLYRGYSTQSILETEKIAMSLSSYNVKAIINTNYKIRYEELFNKFKDFEQSNSIPEKSRLIEEIRQSDDFLRFYNELNNTLAVGYFIDGNYEEALRKDTTISCGSWGKSTTFLYEDGTKINEEYINHGRELNTSLNDGEVILNTNFVEKFFGVDSSTFINNFVPFKIKLQDNYLYKSVLDEPLIEKELLVVGINKSSAPHIHLSYNDYYDLYKTEIFTFGVYFDNPSGIANVYNPIDETLFYSSDKFVDGVYTIMNVVTIFNDFFKLITLAITAVCVVMLISFGQKSIKRRLYEIGVIRALGGKNGELYLTILTQILGMCLLVSIMSSMSLMFLDGYINEILIVNIMRFINNDVIKDLLIIDINPWIIIVNLLGIFTLTILCSLTLMLTLRKIKPINIIRKHEN